MLRLGSSAPRAPLTGLSGRLIPPAQRIAGARRPRATKIPPTVQAKARALAAQQAAHVKPALSRVASPVQAGATLGVPRPSQAPGGCTAALLSGALERLGNSLGSPHPAASPALSDRQSFRSVGTSFGSPPRPSFRELLGAPVTPGMTPRRRSSFGTTDHSSFAVISPPNELHSQSAWSVVGDEREAIEDDTQWTAFDHRRHVEARGSLPVHTELGDPMRRFTVGELERRLDALFERNAFLAATYDAIYKEMAFASGECDVGLAMHGLERCVERLHLEDDLPQLARCFLHVHDTGAAGVLFDCLVRARGKLADGSLLDVAHFLVQLPSDRGLEPQNDEGALRARRDRLVAHWHNQPAGAWSVPSEGVRAA